MSNRIWNVKSESSDKTEYDNGVVREKTMYDGLYKYIAPEGYKFWVHNDCFGNVIWGREILENPYILKSSD